MKNVTEPLSFITTWMKRKLDHSGAKKKRNLFPSRPCLNGNGLGGKKIRILTNIK